MNVSVGIGLAFVAMLCWGFGDFLIQRSTRRVGDWETLLVITLFGSLVLLPFVYGNLPGLFLGEPQGLLVLVLSGLVLTAAAILTLEGLKRGKLAVLEPLLPLELVAASVLAYVVLDDKITGAQTWLIITLFIGLCLLSFRGKSVSVRFFLEKGTLIFLAGAILMGVADFLMGWGSRLTDPLMANFIINIVMSVVSLAVLLERHQGRKIFHDFSLNRGLLLVSAITDNVAWIAYAFAMTLVPIAVATGLSESSVIIAVILGLVVNKERLQRHQIVGLVIAVLAAMILAAVTV